MIELQHKEKNYKIKVNGKKNKIIVSKGFIILYGEGINGTNRVNKDYIEQEFNIPQNISFG